LGVEGRYKETGSVLSFSNLTEIFLGEMKLYSYISPNPGFICNLSLHYDTYFGHFCGTSHSNQEMR